MTRVILALALLAAGLVSSAASAPVIFDSQFFPNRSIAVKSLPRPCTYASTGDTILSVDWRITTTGGTTVWQAPVKDYTAPYCINDGADLDMRMLTDGAYRMVITVDNASTASVSVTRPFSVRNEARADLADLFVDKAFTGTETGSKAAPFNTIQEAANAATAGQTILVRPGIYREQVTLGTGDAGLTIIGQRDASNNRASIRGSDVAGAWTLISGTAYSTTANATTGGTLASIPVSPNSDKCASRSNLRCAYPGQIFVNGEDVFQEIDGGTPNGAPDRRMTWIDGSPYYMANADWIYQNSRYELNIGAAPTAGTVEVSQRAYWIRPADTTVDNVTIRGFDFRHCANNLQQACLKDYAGTDGAVSSDGWTVEWNEMYDTNSYMIALSGSNIMIRNNSIMRSGHTNVGGYTTDGQLIRNRIAYGNREEVNLDWEAGGLKWSFSSGNVTFRENVADGNMGVGLWCDIDCGTTPTKTFTAVGNRVYNNARQGISYEISGLEAPFTNSTSTRTCLIEKNKAWENGWWRSGWLTLYTTAGSDTSFDARSSDTWLWGGGIMVHNSANCEVRQNVAAWNSDGILAVQQCRSKYQQWPNLLGGSTTNDANAANDNPCLPSPSNDSTSDRTQLVNNYIHTNYIALNPRNTNNNVAVGWAGDLAVTYEVANDGRDQWADGNGNQAKYNNRGEGNLIHKGSGFGGGGVGYRFGGTDTGSMLTFNGTFGGDNGTGTASDDTLTEAAFQTSYLTPNDMPLTQYNAAGLQQWP